MHPYEIEIRLIINDDIRYLIAMVITAIIVISSSPAFILLNPLIGAFLVELHNEASPDPIAALSIHVVVI